MRKGTQPSYRTSKSKYLTLQSDGLIDLWSNCLMLSIKNIRQRTPGFLRGFIPSYLLLLTLPIQSAVLPSVFLLLLATYINYFHGTSSLAFITDTKMWFYEHLSNNKSNSDSLRSPLWVHHLIPTETVFHLYHSFTSFCSLEEESHFNLGVYTLVGTVCPIE